MHGHAHPFVFRPATAADAAELSAFAARVFVETFAKDNTPDDMEAYLRSSFTVELQAQEIAEPDAIVLLAFASDEHGSEQGSEQGSRLSGYAHFGRTPKPASVADDTAVELKRFYISHEWQGRGLANSLMQQVKDRAWSFGARTLWLGVWEHNARAISFYRKHGFREVGSHAFVLGRDRQRDLEMAAPLAIRVPNDIEIRRLQPTAADAEDYRAIRLAALQGSPEAFGSVYEIELPRPMSHFVERLTSSVVFGAYENGHIIGMIGFKQHSGLKDAHKGFVWGFYVQPGSRRRGLGAALIATLIDFVRGSMREQLEQLTLAVVRENTAATALYERFGFTIYGVEPRALKSGQGYADEVLMWLPFR